MDHYTLSHWCREGKILLVRPLKFYHFMVLWFNQCIFYILCTSLVLQNDLCIQSFSCSLDLQNDLSIPSFSCSLVLSKDTVFRRTIYTIIQLFFGSLAEQRILSFSCSLVLQQNSVYYNSAVIWFFRRTVYTIMHLLFGSLGEQYMYIYKHLAVL